MNIKDIALPLINKLVPEHSPSLRELILQFAEALVAELAKENKPFCFVYPEITNAFAKVSCGTAYRKRSSPAQIALYTLPPTAEQIEQQTAEACAKLSSLYEDSGMNCIHTKSVAKAIRSGAWKEYL